MLLFGSIHLHAHRPWAHPLHQHGIALAAIYATGTASGIAASAASALAGAEDPMPALADEDLSTVPSTAPWNFIDSSKNWLGCVMPASECAQTVQATAV